MGPFQPQGAAKGCTDSDEKCEEWAVLGECEWRGEGGAGGGRGRWLENVSWLCCEAGRQECSWLHFARRGC